MRRVALISFILGLLIVVDGIFQQVTNYHDGETQRLLQTNITLKDGTTLIISGVVVLVVSVIAFVLSGRQAAGTRGAQEPAKTEERAPVQS